ncbi:2,5-furandicarboxylate decarboxylase 1 [Bradyrhizobium sp. F1.4.3]|uniref:UbiD family decarboxylase n=1 Tax=Bradyrhizobium sp. F1.4.3 TaxID=3156356 RepID=UPI00339844FE
MTDQSMRAFLSQLETSGALHRVKRRTDPTFEIGAVLALKDRGPAILFEQTGSLPVVGNLLVSRERFALGLNVEPKKLDDLCMHALSHPIKPVMSSAAPVQDVVQSGEIDLRTSLPVPTWFERETAPYITAGVIIAKDPENGRRNVSIARLRLEGGGKVMAGIAKNHHLNLLAEKAKALGRRLPIAVAIGNHPAVLLGSQLYLGLGDDEFDNIGGMLGEPLKLVKCKTVDLEVPAEAEIVLEGELYPDEQIEEGPVSEFHGFYVSYGPGMGGRITCITRRKDAIYQAILPGYASEHCLLGGVAIGATLRQALQRMIPAVRRVLITEGGMGRLHAIISMHRPRLGEGKRAAMLAMGQVNLLKLITVVDDDIDIENPREVEWALAARFRGHEDLMVVEGVKADRCDPIHEELTVTKVAMIATTRPGDGEPLSRSEFVSAPKDVLARIAAELEQF